MKTLRARIVGGRSITFFWAVMFSAASATFATAAPLKEARVSQVIEDVKLLQAHGAPRAAVLNDQVTAERAVRTGKESRAELTFNDLTITRLGANTIFSLKAGAREVDLTSGTVLLSVPAGAAPVKAKTVSVTVSVVGGTALFGTGPPTKFMVLEGIGTFYPTGHPERAATVHAGEMMTMTADRKITKPEKFDIKLVLATSALLVDFPPLANLPLIQAVVDQQLSQEMLLVSDQLPSKSFVDVIDVTSQNATANPAVVESTETPAPSPTEPPPTPTPSTSPPPTATPTKFGTPSTITAPNPYLITSGTVITTDPSITTNGTTDFGKIYRGPTDDGPFSLWAFGSTSAFDNALNLDSEFFSDPNHLPIAVFKFQSLSLNGNPIIDTSNGVTKLGLIGVDGITSGRPGGTLTFSGLNLLALATVNGSINLTSDVSFQSLNELAIYARGATSNVIINSPISSIGTLELAAEGSIQMSNAGTMSVGAFDATAGNNLALQIAGSLLLNGRNHLDTLVLPGTTLANGANVTLSVSGDYTNNSITDSSRLRIRNEGAHIGAGGNINANIAGNLTAMSDFNLVVQNTNGQIDNGGNVLLTAGGSISTRGELNLLVENYNETDSPAGHIGTGANVFLGTGGNLTADFASIAINNRGGGMIGSGVNLTMYVLGALTTLENGPDFLGNSQSLSIAISNRYDNSTAGSFIGGDANLVFVSDSASVGGLLSVLISNRGGTIDGSAFSSFYVAHDITVQQNAAWEILNDSGNNMNAASPIGGMIHGDADLVLSANNLTVTAGGLAVDIFNKNGGVVGAGGTIDSDAIITFGLTGNLNTQSAAEFDIFNQAQPGATSGGTIGGNATIALAANSFLVGGTVDVTVNNRNNGTAGGTGGSIRGDAGIYLKIDNTLRSGSTAFFRILNDSVVAESPGGLIDGDATLNVAIGGDFSAGGDLFARIHNDGGGVIGGNATIDFSANSISTNGSDQFPFAIQNLNGGHIGGSADLQVTTATGITANSFATTIDNSTGGMIGSSAQINLNVGSAINLQGTGIFAIFNSSGTIGGAAAVDLAAVNITANSLLAEIDNTLGTIGTNSEGGATINMNVSGTANVTNDATVAIYGSDGAVGGAAININRGNYNIGGTFLSYIDGNGAITFNNAIAHADVLKAGVFGTNGVLNIGGGMLSADSELKLYAPGSNGQLNFVSNVTLGGNSVKILAANSITIFNNVVVTIGGNAPANVYTNHANYTGFGGNGTTTGTFAGAGANNPQPLSNAPPFGPSSLTNIRSTHAATVNTGTMPPVSASAIPRGRIPLVAGNARHNAINVNNTDELLSLLDNAAAGSNGKISLSELKSPASSKNAQRMNTNRLLRAQRQMLIQQTRNREVARVGGKRAM